MPEFSCYFPAAIVRMSQTFLIPASLARVDSLLLLCGAWSSQFTLALRRLPVAPVPVPFITYIGILTLCTAIALFFSVSLRQVENGQMKRSIRGSLSSVLSPQQCEQANNEFCLRRA